MSETDAPAGQGGNSQGYAPQEELPFAIIEGEPLSTPPENLFIPPDALEVILEAFSGPLDLLLYLIKRQNIDILNIPIAKVTHQYMEYIELMQAMKLELVAEYLLMAAMLAEIKSRMLLPRPIEDSDEDDPRSELIRRLQEYEQFKQAAADIDGLPREERDFQLVKADVPEIQKEKPEPDIKLKELLLAFQAVIIRADLQCSHHIQKEGLSVRERMSSVLGKINEANGFVEFNSLFTLAEGRSGLVVSFLAILELLKEHLIDVVQADSFGPIHIVAVDERA